MDEIRAVLFDLGETLLTFGKVGTTKLILQGARSSYDFLRQEGQPIGSFAGYFLRYLVRLRLRYFLAEFRGKDFDSLALLQQVGRREGINFSREQWEEVIWRWYEPLSRLAEIEPDLHEMAVERREVRPSTEEFRLEDGRRLSEMHGLVVGSDGKLHGPGMIWSIEGKDPANDWGGAMRANCYIHCRLVIIDPEKDFKHAKDVRTWQGKPAQ